MAYYHQPSRSAVFKILRDFIRKYFTENHSVKENIPIRAEGSSNSNNESFHRNTTTHHIQNKDQFDEENDL